MIWRLDGWLRFRRALVRSPLLVFLILYGDVTNALAATVGCDAASLSAATTNVQFMAGVLGKSVLVEDVTQLSEPVQIIPFSKDTDIERRVLSIADAVTNTSGLRLVEKERTPYHVFLLFLKNREDLADGDIERRLVFDLDSATSGALDLRFRQRLIQEMLSKIEFYPQKTFFRQQTIQSKNNIIKMTVLSEQMDSSKIFKDRVLSEILLFSLGIPPFSNFHRLGLVARGRTQNHHTCGH